MEKSSGREVGAVAMMLSGGNRGSEGVLLITPTSRGFRAKLCFLVRDCVIIN